MNSLHAIKLTCQLLLGYYSIARGTASIGALGQLREYLIKRKLDCISNPLGDPARNLFSFDDTGHGLLADSKPAGYRGDGETARAPPVNFNFYFVRFHFF
jgi:hypothetical protein